jgi:hypothetical protein
VTTEALEILVEAPTIIDHPHRIQVFFGKTKKTTPKSACACNRQ